MNAFNEDKAVGRLSELIALQYGVNLAYARQIRTAAALHDIGKQKIPDEIILKAGALTKQEFEVIKTHTVIGADMMSHIKSGLGVMAVNCCAFHHEWYNGNGYWGRRTDGLPFYCQFVAVADVFTALISERSYKKPWPPKEAIDYIENQSGTQFCPALVKSFVSLIRNDSRVPAIFAEVRN